MKGGVQDPLIRTISVPNPPIQSFLKSNFNPHLKGSNGGRKMIKKSLSIRLVTWRYSHYVMLELCSTIDELIFTH